MSEPGLEEDRFSSVDELSLFPQEDSKIEGIITKLKSKAESLLVESLLCVIILFDFSF
jgi:hypothetical protein